MRTRACWWTGLLVIVAGTAGCQTRTAGQRFLSFIGVQKEPLSIALVTDSSAEAALGGLDPFPKYASLQKALQADLGRPVVIEPCFAFQGESGLKSGWFDLAFVTPMHYASFAEPEAYRVAAVPVDAGGRTELRAVLIAPRRAALRVPGDVRGQAVAFGPQNDTLTHHAALQMLREQGVERSDLALAALPVPGSLTHYPYMRAVAQAVLSGSSAAGFVTEAYWDELPAHDDGEDVPARDKFHVLGYTERYPIGLVLCSPKMADATVAVVRASLLEVGRTQPAVLEPLGIAGYAAADDDLLARCRQLPATGVEVGAPDAPPLDEGAAGEPQPAG